MTTFFLLVGVFAAGYQLALYKSAADVKRCLERDIAKSPRLQGFSFNLSVGNGGTVVAVVALILAAITA